MDIRRLKKELQVYPPETQVKIVAIGNKAGIMLVDGIFKNQIIIVDQNFGDSQPEVK